jgi:crotonobetainyl-CoA:carnitine CoA-transferase CaiB-like acyl-CoA transferase
MNLVGDFGGGALFLAYGIACALFERASSGTGQVVDAAMLDGTALFMGPWLEAQQAGTWNDVRGTNNLDTGAPYYDVYRCADGQWVAIGALEAHFFAILARKLALERTHVIDVLHEARRAERFGFVEEFVTDRAAARQARLRHRHPQARDLVLRHENTAATTAQLVRHAHRLELLDDLPAVLELELGIEDRESRRGDAVSDVEEEAQHRGRDHGQGREPDRPQAAHRL